MLRRLFECIIGSAENILKPQSMLGKICKNFGRRNFDQIPKKGLSINFGFPGFWCIIPNVAGFACGPGCNVWPIAILYPFGLSV